MGKRGVAPTPTALRLLKGDRADRINTAEPQPSEDAIEPPDYLDAEQLAVWERLAPDLIRQGVLSPWDVDAFAAFCVAVVLHRRAVEYVNRTSVLLKGRHDADPVVKHPAMQVIRDQAAVIRGFGQEFGLTPSARSQLTSPVQQREHSSDRLLS